MTWSSSAKGAHRVTPTGHKEEDHGAHCDSPAFIALTRDHLGFACRPTRGVVEDEINQAEERRYAAMIAGDIGA